MSDFLIDTDNIIDAGTLDGYYAKMADGDRLIIRRRDRHPDVAEMSLLLRKAGFMHVYNRKNHPSRGIHTFGCIKGKREDLLLSVIVPLYNEENTAGKLLDQLIGRQWTLPVEFVIVESNSKDGTREIAQSFADRDNVKLVLEDRPQGKGNGVLNGIKHASGNIIAIQDGDLEYDVNDYDKLLQPFIDGRTQFVLGSRYNKKDWHMRKFKGAGALIADYLNIGQVLLTWILNTALGSKLTDPFTMYKIFDRDCMWGIEFEGGNFGLDWEIVIRFLRKGYKPVEIPISYNARSYAEGKHIALFKTPIEGLRALWKSRYVKGIYDYGEDDYR